MPLEDGEVGIDGPVGLAVLLKPGAITSQGGLSIGVGSFDYDLAGTKGIFAGAVSVALTDNTTNYVYLDQAGALQVNTTGYPASNTVHIRLATITTAGGVVTNCQDTRALLTSAITGGGGGEVNTGANVGAGTGLIFRDKTGTTLNFRTVASLVAAITVATAGDVVNLSLVPASILHNTLGGLTTGDPHTQYILVAGTRPFTGNQSFGNNSATNLRNATYQAEFNNGNSGVAATITWTNGQKQRLTLTGNATLTFVNPPGPCNLMLKLIQDGTGNRNVSWPASVRWRNGNPPNLTTPGGSIDLIALYFDGTNYYGVSSLNFS